MHAPQAPHIDIHQSIDYGQYIAAVDAGRA